MIRRHFGEIMLSLSLLLSLSACEKSEMNMDAEHFFNSSKVIFPECKEILDVEFVDNTFLAVGENEIGEKIVYSLGEANNPSLRVLTILPANTNYTDYCFLSEDRIVCSSVTGIYIYNLLSAGLIDSYIIDLPENTYLQKVSNGFIVAYSDHILLLDNNCNLMKSIEDSAVRNIAQNNPIKEHSDGIYIALGSDFSYDYYDIDFDNGLLIPICSSSTFTNDLSNIYMNPYYIVDYFTHDISGIDFETMNCFEIASYRNMLIPPSISGNLGDDEITVVDDYLFITIRNYINYPPELVITYEDPDLNLNNRILICVGAFKSVMSNNQSLANAMYLFNTSQSEYLVTVDYYEDYAEYNPNLVQASLISAFNNGKTPDIFVGSGFDYNSFGYNNLAIDLAPYIDDSIGQDALQPCISNLIYNEDGTCFQIMAGYYPIGPWGRSDIFSSNEVSICDIYQLENEISLFGGAYHTEDLARYAILDLGNNINSEDILSILEYSDEYGLPPDSTTESNYWIYDLSDNNTLLVDCTGLTNFGMINRVETIANSRLTYVGYPSADGSVHPLVPECLVAISSNSEYPNACWEFISYLLSRDIQMMNIASINQRFPVVQEAMDSYCSFLLNPESIPSDDYFSQTAIYRDTIQYGDSLVSAEAINHYRSNIESVDMIYPSDDVAINIIHDEIDSHYLTGQSFENISETLISRLDLYYSE